MVQYIKNANIFGRIGENLGKGLAEQLPKSVERGRLSSALKDIGERKDQTPFQQFTALASQASDYPQIVQSGSELLRQQAQGNAYRKGIGGNQRTGRQQENVSPQDSPQNAQALRDTQFANFQPQQPSQTSQQGQRGQKIPPVGPVNNQQATPNMGSEENIPKVIEGNALNEQNLTRLPWTPQQRNQTIADYIDQGFLPDQAKQLQADDEARDLSEPAAYQQRQEDIKKAKGEVREALKRHLETKLQKTGENVYKDVEGKMILNAERGMTRDLIKNPKADIDNVANDWSERLANTAIAKDRLRTMGKTTGIENLFKGNSSEKKLAEYQDIFKRSGNLEEFNKMLQGEDFGMSPQAAASVAYPPNPKINKFISNYKPSILNTYKKYGEASKAAIDLGELIESDDSILAIARKLSQKDPFFDQQSFFDQISEDKDQLRLNERQRRELAEGIKNWVPNWADLLYLPYF